MSRNGREKKPEGRDKKLLEKSSQYHTLAIEIAIAIIVPVLIGHWLDSRTGKEPWFTIAGMVLGAAAAFRSVQRTYSKSIKEDKQEKEMRSGSSDEPDRDSSERGSNP